MAMDVLSWIGEEVSEEDFARMMADETFVDFFNVFLSLPAFSQKLLYIYPKKYFEFDPPLRRRNNVLQRNNVVKWLMRERLPLFIRSEFYLDYLLCKRLLQLTPHLTPSSHRLDYEDARIYEDKAFVKAAVGNVIGICNFHKFLQETKGGQLLSFWKDAERFNRIPAQYKSKREACFREIQIKYFRPEGLVNLQDNSLWQALRDSSVAMGINYKYFGEQKTPPPSFKKLQSGVLSLLKDYWLQRYILHLMNKDPTKENFVGADGQLKRDLKNIDKTLSFAQRSNKSDKKAYDATAAFNWHAMFPHIQIDDNFLQSTDDVVTIHKDNKITLCPATSEFEVMLQRYFSDTDSDEEDRASSPKHVPNWETGPVGSQKDEDPESKTRKLVSRIRKAEQENKEKKMKSNIIENLTLFDQMVLMNDAYKKVDSTNLTGDVQRPRTSDENKPRKGLQPIRTGSLHVNVRLPLLGSRWERDQSKYRKHIEREKEMKEKKKNIIPHQFPPILETAQLEGVITELPTTRRPPEVNLLEFKFTNLNKGYYRCDNKLFLASIALDSVCGRPFASYLHKYKHHEALLAIRLWSEIHTYLSLKPAIRGAAVYERLRFWRAHKMIVKFLSKELPISAKKSKEMLIPKNARLALQKRVLSGKGDDLLAIVQDYLSKDIFVLWQSFTYIDKEDLEESAITKDPTKNVLVHVPKTPRTVQIKASSSGISKVDILAKYRKIVEKAKPPARVESPKSKTLRFTLAHVVEEVMENESVTGKTTSAEKSTGATDDKTPPKSPVEKTPPEKDTAETKSPDQQASGKGKQGEKKRPPVSKTDTKAKKSKKNKRKCSLKKKSSEQRTESPPKEFVEEVVYTGLEERRMWRAVQIVAYLTNLETESLLLDPLPLHEIEYNADEASGSLALKRLTIIRRRDIVEAEARKKEFQVQAYNTRMALLKKKEVEELPPEFLDESVPEWAKPFKGEFGQWIFRQGYPKNFGDIFKDPNRIEFFRRFLVAHDGVAQLNFWNDVEIMKTAKDSAHRQQKINQILRRYFLSKRGYLSLDCTDDVIKEIPRMEKVTPGMLISGQACIARCLEQKWFQRYQSTFPEPDGEEEDKERKEVKRKWTTERSRALWVQFVRTVMRFRHAILDPQMAKDFTDFLRFEIMRETEKQKASGINYVPGLPIKKVVQNKLIDITKLTNDLTFLAEAERFRSLCDNAADAAKQGIYKPDDQELLDLKAHIIITCYLDSEIPPRIQINASSDSVDEIMAAFQSGHIDRGLFHTVTIGIFPVLAFMWKKFQRFRYAQMFGPIRIDATTKIPPDRASSPKFMELRHTDGKRVMSLHEDDHPRMVFSLLNGLRVILPPTREQLLRRAIEVTLGRGCADGSVTDMPTTKQMTLALLGQQNRRHSRISRAPSSTISKHQVTEEGEGHSGSTSGSNSVRPTSNLARRDASYTKEPENPIVQT